MDRWRLPRVGQIIYTKLNGQVHSQESRFRFGDENFSNVKEFIIVSAITGETVSHSKQLFEARVSLLF